MVGVDSDAGSGWDDAREAEGGSGVYTEGFVAGGC